VTRRAAAVLAAVTVAAGVVVLAGLPVAQVIGGLLLAFVLPGAALTAALFRDRVALTVVERSVLIPALSLAVLVIGGLTAWAFTVPIHRATWLGVSALVTLAALGATAARPQDPTARSAETASPRVKLPTPKDATLILPVFLDREGTFEQPASRWRMPTLPVRRLAPIALALALLGSGSAVAVEASVRIHEVAVTSLSAAPPGAASVTGDRVVQVTATGLTAGAGAYTVLVKSPSGVTTERHPVTADPDGRWTGRVTVAGGERTTIGLYRAGETVAYRTVIIAAA
jgi:hypothetical protein